MAVYNWTPGNTGGPSYTAYNGGEYYLTTTDNNGCTAKDSIPLTMTPNNILPPLVKDTTACKGESVTLLASGPGSITWYSSSKGGSVLGTGASFATPPIDTTAIFYVGEELGGCKSNHDSATVKITECGSVYIPNVFTPNGDGQNDVFYATIKGARCFDCKIYNRWGVLIYEWKDVTKGWNGTIQQSGKPASDGTYYYIIDYCSYLDVANKKDGFITLIR